MQMKIGIYLAYAPFPPGASLKNEGLGRYLALLISNFLQGGHTIVLACPNWSKEMLSELLTDYAIPMDELELLTTTSDPIALQLYYKWQSRKSVKRPKWRGKFAAISYRLLAWIFIDVFLSVKNIVSFTLLMLACVLLGMLSVPVVIPLLLIAAVIKAGGCFWKKFFKANASFVGKGSLRRLSKLQGMALLLEKIRHIIASADVLEKLRVKAAKELLQKVQRLKEPPDIWYCPTAFWPEFGSIDGVAVTCIPDIVMNEFALEFAANSLWVKTSKKLDRTIKNSSYFITYCNYIKKSVLIDKKGVDSSRVIPIMMFTNEMHSYLDVQSSFPFHKNANQLFARNMLDTARIYLVNPINSDYMSSDTWFSLKNVKYIFYSSQVRQHKNILNLVKAYEYLLRREKITCKLFLTGRYTDDSQLFQYIRDHQLQNEVLCFFNVPNITLAALYACAELCVNPTLYEGGFPFTFAEGMSVGTPSVMSRIPQVTEFTNGWGIDDCLFDPYNYQDIADKIFYGLTNRDKLIEKQMPLYKAHSERTTSGQAGQEYIMAFEKFIQLSKNAEKKNA